MIQSLTGGLISHQILSFSHQIDRKNNVLEAVNLGLLTMKYFGNMLFQTYFIIDVVGKLQLMYSASHSTACIISNKIMNYFSQTSLTQMGG